MNAPVRPVLDTHAKADIQRLTPEQRRAFEHERRRRADDMDALIFGVWLPEIAENLMLGPRHA